VEAFLKSQIWIMHLHNCTKFGYASCLNATQNPLCTHQSCRLFHPPPSLTKLHKALVQLQHFLFVCRTPVQNGSMHAVFAVKLPVCR